MKCKKILLIIIFLTLTACNTNLTDSERFKKEYEKYNNEKIELNISKTNIIKYQTKEEINKIIDSKTGVIFIGTPRDNKSRTSIKLLLDAADNTDLQEIYYIDKIDGIDLTNIKDVKNTIVLFVLKGEIKDYSINEKEKLTEDEEIDLYNKYLEGIHEVLQDTCDEEC